MRILLTGRTGQVGRALETRLPALGEIVATGRDRLDLGNPDSIMNALDEVQPDVIVNAAAYTAVDKAESEPDAALRINAHAPRVMADWVAKHDAAILHYSTDYVFDGNSEMPWRETDASHPVNVYGESKRAGEQAIIASGAAHLIIRTSWVYAARGANFLLTMLRLARERVSLQIVADQFGAPTPAWWLAETTVQLLDREHLFGTSQDGLLHAAPDGRTSWHGFATAIFEGARNRKMALTVEEVDAIPAAAYPTPAKRPQSSVFCLDRLRDEYSISPPHWRVVLDPVLDEVARQDITR